MIYLIRHSNPHIDETVAAHYWQLSSIGISRAHLLANHLEARGIQAVASSAEPKAYQTAQILAEHLNLDLEVFPGLHEHKRPLSKGKFASREEFCKQVAQFFSHPDQLIFGSETANQAFSRFNDAIHQVLEHYLGKSVAVVSHGTVISLYASRQCGLDAYPFWLSLGLPACISLNLPDFDILEIWTPPESTSPETG